MLLAQAREQRVAVRILGGDQREVALAAGGQRLRRAQRTDHAGGFVGVLGAGNEDGGTGAAQVGAQHRPALARGGLERVAAQGRHAAGDLRRRQRLARLRQREPGRA